MQLPHPIPYQGSKRKLSISIATFVNSQVDTLFEPFAGSAAFTLYAAQHELAEKFVIGDSLEPLIELWKLIVTSPEKVSSQYQVIWKGQTEGDTDYFYRIREQYNETHDPIKLLYLIARCVKNAVRFSKNGRFTQSVDKRRKGMRPDKMRKAVYGASSLLTGRVSFFAGDFEQCIADASTKDLVYMDPPYQGITYGQDKRYYEQLHVDRLITVLHNLNERNIPVLLSYDGKHGDKEYGISLPHSLNMQKFLLNAGRSSQATLNGKNTITLESLYVSSNLLSKRTDDESMLPIIEQLPLPF